MTQSLPTTASTIRNSSPYSFRAGAIDFLKLIFFTFSLLFLISIVPCASFALIRLQPTLPEFKLKSSVFSPIFKINATTTWNLTFSVQNPNNHSLFFNQITASAYHDKESLANASIFDFELPAGKNRINLGIRFSGIRWRWNSLRNCSAVGNGVWCEDLKVALRGRARFGGWTWPEEWDLIRAECTAAFDSGWECEVSGRWKDIKGKSVKIFHGYVLFAGLALCILLISF